MPCSIWAYSIRDPRFANGSNTQFHFWYPLYSISSFSQSSLVNYGRHLSTLQSHLLSQLLDAIYRTEAIHTPKTGKISISPRKIRRRQWILFREYWEVYSYWAIAMMFRYETKSQYQKIDILDKVRYNCYIVVKCKKAHRSDWSTRFGIIEQQGSMVWLFWHI